METKFRAVSHRGIEIIEDLYWFEENMVHSFEEPGYEFDRFTGFQDKNGVDIFENDVLKSKNFCQSPYDSDKQKTTRVVKRSWRDNNLYLFHAVGDKEPASGKQLNYKTCNSVEVIGRAV